MLAFPNMSEAVARRPVGNMVVQTMKASRVVSARSSNCVWSHHTSNMPLERATHPEQLLFLMTNERH